MQRVSAAAAAAAMFRSEWNAAGEKQKDIFVVLSVKVSARENVPHSRSLSCHAAYPVRKDPSLSFRGLPSAGSHFLAQTEDGETKREGEAKAFSSLSLSSLLLRWGGRGESLRTRKKESQNGGGEDGRVGLPAAAAALTCFRYIGRSEGGSVGGGGFHAGVMSPRTRIVDI